MINIFILLQGLIPGIGSAETAKTTEEVAKASGEVDKWKALSLEDLVSRLADSAVSFAINLAVAIVVFYAVYPLLYKVIKGGNYWIWVLILALGYGAALLLYQDQAAFYRINGFVFRIPIFLIGCFLAPQVKRGKEYSLIPTALLCTVGAMLMWYLWIDCDPWFLRMYLFTPLSLCLVFLGSIVLSFLRKDGVIQRFLLFFGGMTLELYLVHEKLLAALRPVFPNHNVAVNGLAVLLAIGLAWCLKRLCERFSP